MTTWHKPKMRNQGGVWTTNDDANKMSRVKSDTVPAEIRANLDRDPEPGTHGHKPGDYVKLNQPRITQLDSMGKTITTKEPTKESPVFGKVNAVHGNDVWTTTRSERGMGSRVLPGSRYEGVSKDSIPENTVNDINQGVLPKCKLCHKEPPTTVGHVQQDICIGCFHEDRVNRDKNKPSGTPWNFMPRQLDNPEGLSHDENMERFKNNYIDPKNGSIKEAVYPILECAKCGDVVDPHDDSEGDAYGVKNGNDPSKRSALLCLICGGILKPRVASPVDPVNATNLVNQQADAEKFPTSFKSPAPVQRPGTNPPDRHQSLDQNLDAQPPGQGKEVTSSWLKRYDSD